MNYCELLLGPLALLTDIVDYISKQSDRWLFIGLEVVFLVILFIFARWGMKKIDARDKRIDDLQRELSEMHKEFLEYQQQATTYQAAQAERFAAVIALNTSALAMLRVAPPVQSA